MNIFACKNCVERLGKNKDRFVSSESICEYCGKGVFEGYMVSDENSRNPLKLEDCGYDKEKHKQGFII